MDVLEGFPRGSWKLHDQSTYFQYPSKRASGSKFLGRQIPSGSCFVFFNAQVDMSKTAVTLVNNLLGCGGSDLGRQDDVFSY